MLSCLLARRTSLSSVSAAVLSLGLATACGGIDDPDADFEQLELAETQDELFGLRCNSAAERAIEQKKTALARSGVNLGSARSQFGFGRICKKTFTRGAIWTSPSRTVGLWGPIYTKYKRVSSTVGSPRTDVRTAPDREGKYAHFSKGASIYYTRRTGAHEVHGAIRSMWSRNSWERRAGYPLTDETSMANDEGRYNTFQHATVSWTPKMGAWYDFHGNDNAGHVSGWAKLCKHSRLTGTCRWFSASNARPILFQKQLRDGGVHDNITSLQLSGVPNTSSLYLYQHADMTGRWVAVSGNGNGSRWTLNNLNDVSGGMNDRTSSAQLVNHGTLSVRVGIDEMNSQVNAPSSDSCGNLQRLSHQRTRVFFRPGERKIVVRTTGEISVTGPNPDVRSDLYFRLSVDRHASRGDGTGAVRMTYAGYSTKVSGVPPWKRDDVRRQLRRQEPTVHCKGRAAAAAMTEGFNTQLDQMFLGVDFLCAAEKAQINVRRTNILPDAIEIVLSDKADGPRCVSRLPIPGDAADAISTSRPNRRVRSGRI